MMETLNTALGGAGHLSGIITLFVPKVSGSRGYTGKLNRHAPPSFWLENSMPSKDSILRPSSFERDISLANSYNNILEQSRTVLICCSPGQ